MNNTLEPKNQINIGNVIIGLCLIILFMVSCLSIAEAVANGRMEGKIDTINTALAPTVTEPVKVVQVPTIEPSLTPSPTLDYKRYDCIGTIFGSNVVGYDKPDRHSTALLIFDNGQAIYAQYLSEDLHWVMVGYQVWKSNGTKQDYGSIWVPAININVRNCPMMAATTPQATQEG